MQESSTATVVPRFDAGVDQVRLLSYKQTLEVTFSIALACFVLLAVDVAFALALQSYCGRLQSNPLMRSYASNTLPNGTLPTGYFGGAFPDIVAVAVAGWPKMCQVEASNVVDDDRLKCGLTTAEGVNALVRWQMVWIIILILGFISFILFMQYRSMYYAVLQGKTSARAARKKA